MPEAAPHSCKADAGPYRKVRIDVERQLAGIAAPDAFEVQHLRYDLTVPLD